MLGLYDSGIGGFSILKEIRQISPEINFQYLADTEILPLGDKTQDFIQKRVKKAVSFLFNQGCSIVILACNTAAVNSVREVQQNWLTKNFPKKQVLSLTRPLIEDLQEKQLNTKKGLLIATKATIDSGFYQQELKQIGYQNTDFLACPSLASCIENRCGDLKNILNKELKITQNSLDLEFLILACTHYPLIKKELKQHFKTELKIIDPAKMVAKKLKDYLQRHPEYQMLSAENKFWTTGRAGDLDFKIRHYLGCNVGCKRCMIK